MRIFGADPGYAITGWGVLDRIGSRITVAGSGALLTDSNLDMPVRLRRLFEQIGSLFSEFRPDAAVVERLYFNKNTTTAPGVYQARGVILLAAAMADCRVIELTPASIKKGITGSGRAGKREVIRMVERLLDLKGAIPLDDTADALAAAFAGIAVLSSPDLRKDFAK